MKGVLIRSDLVQPATKFIPPFFHIREQPSQSAIIMGGGFIVKSDDEESTIQQKIEYKFFKDWPAYNHRGYGDLKRIAETRVGVVSQCCLYSNIGKLSSQFLANLALKINAIFVSDENHVLWDENHFTSDEFQKLVYNLCYTFMRCTKPVSLVPPPYYALLAAYRGRLYLERFDSTSPNRSNTIISRAAPPKAAPLPNFSENVKNVMFYC